MQHAVHDEVDANYKKKRDILATSLSNLMGDEYNNTSLADTIGADRTTVGAWLSKNPSAMRAPDLRNISLICDLFGCDIGHLFGEYDECTYDTHKICEKTGLTENTVKLLTNADDRAVATFVSWLVEYPDIYSFAWNFFVYRASCMSDFGKQKISDTLTNTLEPYIQDEHKETAMGAISIASPDSTYEENSLQALQNDFFRFLIASTKTPKESVG